MNTLTCPRCGYTWSYRGRSLRAKCPICGYTFRINSIDRGVVNSNVGGVVHSVDRENYSSDGFTTPHTTPPTPQSASQSKETTTPQSIEMNPGERLGHSTDLDIDKLARMLEVVVRFAKSAIPYLRKIDALESSVDGMAREIESLRILRKEIESLRGVTASVL